MNGISGKISNLEGYLLDGSEVIMSKRSRKTPQRTCVGCREVHAKFTMTRIVRTPDGVKVDPTGKENGRGAYLHDHPACWENGLKGAVARALKVQISSDDELNLRGFLETRIRVQK